MERLQFDRDANEDLRKIVRYIGVEQMRPETARKVARKIYREMPAICPQPVER